MPVCATKSKEVMLVIKDFSWLQLLEITSVTKFAPVPRARRPRPFVPPVQRADSELLLDPNLQRDNRQLTERSFISRGRDANDANTGSAGNICDCREDLYTKRL